MMFQRSFRTCGLSLALILAGCTVGPDYQTPEMAVPAQWNATQTKDGTDAASLSQWWRQLDDPLLNELIGEAVQGNLDVATAKAKIREARATWKETSGSLFPSVTGSGSATRTGYNSSSFKATQGVGATYNEFQAGFDASWELDLFGANHRAVEAATRAEEAAEADLRSTLLTLVGDVAAYYVEARGYQARAALARATADSERQTAKLTRVKFDAGSASALDAVKADAEADSTEADIPGYETSYAEAVHRLSILLGQEPSALTGKLEHAAPIPSPALALPSGLPADILNSRPDVLKAERQLAQYTAKIGQAEAARYPSISLTGSIATSSLQAGDLAKTSSLSWAFGPSISIPIFNAGQLEAAVEVAEAQRDQYFIAYRSAVLTALEDVENATVSLSKERVRRQSLEQAVQHYQDAMRMSRVLYQSGSSSFLDVLDAERSLYSAEDSSCKAGSPFPPITSPWPRHWAGDGMARSMPASLRKTVNNRFTPVCLKCRQTGDSKKYPIH